MKNELKNSGIGILVARMQTYKLSAGHKYLLDAVLAKHQKVILFLGEAATKTTHNNPLPFKARKLMVLKSYPKDKYPNFDIEVINDVYNNTLWSKNLDAKIEKLYPNEIVTIYGSRSSICDTYSGKHKIVELAPTKSMSGTEYRESIKAEILDDENFRRGWICACFDKFSCQYPAVDAIIFNEDRTKILLGRKEKTPPNKWVTPGGFYDKKDKSFETAIVREIMEETGLTGIGQPVYLGSAQIEKDPRYINELDGIVSSIFLIFDTIGEFRAADDLEGLQWFYIKDLIKQDGKQFVEYHEPIWELFKKNYLDKLTPDEMEKILKTI